jgi:Ribbon-helix-helix domain
MIRVNYHLTLPQLAALRTASRKTGLTVAELIRRAVDAYLKR